MTDQHSAAAYLPPAKYTRSDGAITCPHGTPVAPGSCEHCWELHQADCEPCWKRRLVEAAVTESVAPIDWARHYAAQREQQASEHCGSTEPKPLHSSHQFMRGGIVYRCPGGATEQPARHTVDTITSDALDQLYTELAEYRNALNWQTNCLACSRVLDGAYRETVRAEQAEAALARVRDTAKCWEQMPSDRHVYIREAARALRTALDEPQEPRP